MRSWLSFSVAVLVGCQSNPITPVPRSVAPEWGFSGEDTRVDIYGDGLIPALDIAADGYYRVRAEGTDSTGLA